MYRHFQNLDELGWACSGLYFERHPLPDYEPWRAVPGGRARLQVALRDAYAYHRSTEPMMTRILGLYRDDEALLPYYAHWKAATDLVAAGYEQRRAAAARRRRSCPELRLLAVAGPRPRPERRGGRRGRGR